MGDEETSSPRILEQFQQISNKLKKRFMRKPNVTEALESFTSLAQECENLILPTYAALCWNAAAKCEESLGNTQGETTCLLKTARQFGCAEEKHYNLGFTSAIGDTLQACLGCYMSASSRMNEQKMLQIGLDLEVAQFLHKINRLEYAENYLQHALSISDSTTLTKLHCLELLAKHFIDTGDYVSALNTTDKIIEFWQSEPDTLTKSDSLRNCEINSVFLLLILKPNPQKLSTDAGRILEKYTWGDKNEKSLRDYRMKEEIFLLLQSLVMISQSLDKSGLCDLETEFWRHLTKQQKELLRVLVKLYTFGT